MTIEQFTQCIPCELSQYPQWVVWKKEERNGKATKIPFDPNRPEQHASTTNPLTWGTFDEAIKAYETFPFAGIGYVFSNQDPFTGIDLDHCRDATTGELEPWAEEIVTQLDSYTEVSHSGMGLHVIVRAQLPAGGNRKGRLEMYDQGRYFCMTGEHVEGKPFEILSRQAALNELHQQTFMPTIPRDHDTPLSCDGVPQDDQELLRRAMTARNGAEFQALWQGDTSAYPSQSEADLALCSHLAFWTGGDPGRMDRLYRQSGLMRAKWDAWHGEATYGDKTIQKACEGRTEFYHPGDRSQLTGQTMGTTRRLSVQSPDTLLTSAGSWPILQPEALYGVAGEFTKAVSPYSEADPVGILLHTLLMCGCWIGSGPHALVEHQPHPPRLFALQVGKTAAGRKGTAASHPKLIFSRLDPDWTKQRLKSGLSTGEGLTYLVRDEHVENVPIKKNNRPTGEFESVVTDVGEADKRLLIIESEFANVLKVMQREGSTLSAKMRDAWDHGNLSPLTKTDRVSATHAHINILGHITINELRRYLTVTERANGFANRFLFALTRRAQFIASGKGAPPEILDKFVETFSRMLRIAQGRGVLARDPGCEELWEGIYPDLEADLPELAGEILGRGAAQVLRLSLLYALLDPKEANSPEPAIRTPHLMAALALWDYCKASVFYIFGEALGDPIADRILQAIKLAPQTDTDLYGLLGRHRGDSARKEQALDFLVQANRIHGITVPTTGRTLREWHYGEPQGCALCAKRV